MLNTLKKYRLQTLVIYYTCNVKSAESRLYCKYFVKIKTKSKDIPNLRLTVFHKLDTVKSLSFPLPKQSLNHTKIPVYLTVPCLMFFTT